MHVPRFLWPSVRLSSRRGKGNQLCLRLLPGKIISSALQIPTTLQDNVLEVYSNTGLRNEQQY